MIKIAAVIAFLSSLALSVQTSKSESDPPTRSDLLPTRTDPCPCSSSPVQITAQNGQCAKTTFSFGTSSGGECETAGGSCNQYATETPCHFDFHVLIEAKTPPLPSCCESATYTFTSRVCFVDGSCSPTTNCDIGLPIPITRPFEQNVDDYGVNCGLAAGFKIVESCGGTPTTLVDANLKCCKC